METFHYYKGFDIRYYQLTGTTVVEFLGEVFARYPLEGEIEGKRLAHKFVDSYVKEWGEIDVD